MAVNRNVHRTVNILIAHPGHDFQRLARRDHADIQPDTFGLADVSLQGLVLQFAGSDAQTADFFIGTELCIQLGTVFAKTHHGG